MQGNSLVLNNIKYNVKEAKVSFTDIGGNFKMFIDISADSNDVEYELSYIRLYNEEGFLTGVNNYDDLKGKKYVWDSIENESGEFAGSLYVLEHEDITKGTIEILDCNSSLIKIKWSGIANVYWNEKFGANVPFEAIIETEIPKEKRVTIYAHKCTKIKVNDKLELELLNFEEIKNAAYKMQETRVWDSFNERLNFKVVYNNEEYLGYVIYTNGKLNYETFIDGNCPIKIEHKGFDWQKEEFEFRFNLIF